MPRRGHQIEALLTISISTNFELALASDASCTKDMLNNFQLELSLSSGYPSCNCLIRVCVVYLCCCLQGVATSLLPRRYLVRLTVHLYMTALRFLYILGRIGTLMLSDHLLIVLRFAAACLFLHPRASAPTRRYGPSCPLCTPSYHVPTFILSFCSHTPGESISPN